MCYIPPVQGLEKWNWDGDTIVHDCIVPSSRPIPGTRSRKGYDIDIREFLVSENNAVMHRTIHETLKAYAAEQRWFDWAHIRSRNPGSFDARANLIASYVYQMIGHKEQTKDEPWLFPDETLALGKGDCEDRAFLIASLMLASGISPFNIRVALGAVHMGTQRAKHHAWVMYKNEAGSWILIEPNITADGVSERPARSRGRRKSIPDAVEYEPYFVFNNEHLWKVNRSRNNKSFASLAKEDFRWNGFNPSFAGEVHKSIISEALRLDLQGYPVTAEVDAFRHTLESYFTKKVFFWLVDNVDLKTYDPLEHFDNGLIDESWQRVSDNKNRFLQDRQPETFSLVAHAIADFYAHSSYPHFATLDASPGADMFLRYSPAQHNIIAHNIRYTSASGFNLLEKKYSINTNRWQGKLSQRPGLFEGKIISGRYAQPADEDRPGAGFSIEEMVSYFSEPGSRQDWDGEGYIRRHPNIACMPHHYEIAVDDEHRHSKHVLYTDDTTYQRQYVLRKNTAAHHIREVFFELWEQL